MTTKSKPRSIEEALDYLGVEIANVGDREISAHCPFHSDRHPSFSMNASTGLWVCFQCGAGGTLEGLITQLSEGDVLTPKGFLREVRFHRVARPGPDTHEPLPTIDSYELQARFGLFKRPPEWATAERMIKASEITRYDVRWSRGWIIPIWSPARKRTLRGWQFKRLDTVLNYPVQVKKSHTLFGLQEAIGTKTIALVESPLDVLRLRSAREPVVAVASFGAFVSNEQVHQIVERFDRIILALDNDNAGLAQMFRLYKTFSRQMATRVLRYPEGVKDPGEMTDVQIEDCIDFYR